VLSCIKMYVSYKNMDLYLEEFSVVKQCYFLMREKLTLSKISNSYFQPFCVFRDYRK